MSQLTDYKVDELTAQIETLSQRIEELSERLNEIERKDYTRTGFVGGALFVFTSLGAFVGYLVKEYVFK